MRLVASHIAGCLLSSPHSMSSGGKQGLCISFRYSIWMRSKALQFLWALGSSQWTNYSTKKSFFSPAGSQREREVVASLSKHAAVRCYAKTPKDFLITSQFKKCWRLTPPPPTPSQPSSRMADLNLKCCSTDLQHLVASIFQSIQKRQWLDLLSVKTDSVQVANNCCTQRHHTWIE